MDYNRNNRGDVYATHGIGPACQLLNIHRGDRMKTLVAVDTKAVNGPAYIRKTTGEEVKDFQNGDQTTTVIRTENGKTILIQHNVMTPGPCKASSILQPGTDLHGGPFSGYIGSLLPCNSERDVHNLRERVAPLRL